MSLRFSLILMIVFVALGYLAFFEPLRTAEKDEDKAEHESHVVWLKDRKLEWLELAGEKGSVRLECVAKEKACPFDGSGEWAMKQPEAAGADPTAIGTAASTILNLTQNGKLDFDKGYDEKEYGLDKPKASATLKLAGEPQPITLKLGSASPTGPNVYASVSSDPKHVFLVPNYVAGMLDQDAFHWRSKRLFPAAEATAVKTIRWKTKKLEARASKDGDEWRLEKPRAVAASRIMLEGLGSTLSYAAAKSIFAASRAGTQAKAVLKGAPELEVSFTLNGGGEHSLKLYPKAGAPNARDRIAVVDDQPTVYVVDGAVFDRFEKELPEYRQRSVIGDAQRSPLDGVRFLFPRDKKEITLQLKDSLWTPTGGDKPAGMISQARVNGFLDQLRDSDYKVFLPAAGASAEAKDWRSHTPDLRVELSAGGKKIAEAAFLVHDRKVALTESEGDVRTFGDAFLKFLPVRLSDLTEESNRAVVVKPEKGGADGEHSESEHEHH